MAIGEAIPMLDSVGRVTGAVEYMVNLKMPNMLVGKIVRSIMPHARIVRLDVSAAERVPGVRAILTSADVSAMYGVGISDQHVVASERVRFVGEPIVAIAAEDREAADDAASRVEIEYGELPVVFDASEAVKQGAPTLHEKFPNNIFRHGKLRHGDLDKGFADAGEIFEDTFTSPAAQHSSLEPHAAIAQWNGDKLTVWTGTQAPYTVRNTLAQIFGIAPTNVRVVVPPIGGGYGGKGGIRLEPIAAALSRKTNGRPVKIVLSRAEEFFTITKHAAVLKYKTGVKRDGTLTARQVTIHWNGGAYADQSASLVMAAVARAVGPYRIPNVWVDSYGVYTNLPPAGAYRGAMSSQTTWAYESQMNMIARRMGFDPYEFRMKNLLRDGDEFATGEKMHDVHFVECLEKAVGDLKEARHITRASHLKRGIGHAVMMKSMIPTSKSESRLNFSSEGTLTLYTSTVELGQGSHTALAQIAADAMDLPMRAVRVVGPDTEVTPYDATTASARSTSMMGNAIVAAAKELTGKLLALAAPILETPPEELRVERGRVLSKSESVSFEEILKRNAQESVEALGAFETKLGIDPETGQGVATPHWHQGAGAVEIEVDTETGKVTVLRFSAASWAGRVVNPRLAELQNDGNVIFGLGPTLMEEIVFDGGQVYNPNFSDYPIPSFHDIPLELVSAALEKPGAEIHGIGEMTLPPVAPAIASAIEDAVGVRITDLPITPEKILRAIKETRKDVKT